MKSFVIILSIILLTISSTLSAQQNYSENNGKRLFTGGGFGLQFGTETIIDVSPIIGYKVTDRFHIGLGGKYQYYRYKNRIYDFSTSIYGGSAFSRFYLFEDIFAHGEYEVLSYDASLVYYLNPNDNSRILVESILLGGGYRQRITTNSSFIFLLLWNFNETEYTLYNNPIIRIGINVDF